MAIRYSQTPNKLEILEEIYAGMDTTGRFVEVGGPIIEALITEYGVKGHHANATHVFENILGASNEACLRAILQACARADPEPKWEQVCWSGGSRDGAKMYQDLLCSASDASLNLSQAVSILHSSDITRSSAGSGHIDQVALGHAMIACAKADRWEEGLNLLLLYGVKSKRLVSNFGGGVAVLAQKLT
jgi:hypothetical protein